MKKVLIISAMFASIISCKKKTNDGEPAFVWPTGTGEYAPYTLNSTFTYETTNAGVIDSFTYTVTKDTVLDGLPCRKLESNKPLLASNIYVNYNNGVRTEYNLNTSFNGFAIPLIKQEVLKTATLVNANWTGSTNVTIPAIPPTLPIPLSVPITYTYTMVQKDIVKNILQKDYSGTYAVKQVSSLPATIVALLPAGTPASVTIDNFYSKGVGISQRDAVATSFKIKRFKVIM
jgi:hypothetical protein